MYSGREATAWRRSSRGSRMRRRQSVAKRGRNVRSVRESERVSDVRNESRFRGAADLRECHRPARNDERIDESRVDVVGDN